MSTLAKVEHTSYLCPAAWNGWDEDGNYYRLKYRRGTGRVLQVPRLGGFAKLVIEFKFGDPRNGFIELEEFCRLSGVTLALAEPYVPLEDPNAGIEDYPEPDWSA